MVPAVNSTWIIPCDVGNQKLKPMLETKSENMDVDQLQHAEFACCKTNSVEEFGECNNIGLTWLQPILLLLYWFMQSLFFTMM